ncbi:HAD-IIB family hydrolase [Anaerobutyricum hallii]|uniref:HAD-IIB family hydrolase n=1 Tax=Anaerobutyricum hallii TaxID=39488 RepID=UPI001C02DA92|nr:HAD-IIB family hydrolase [Anaerobutyricum hallii]MBT9715188.1 HAD-IIB family hydrolase [Anaerobutyricum hallii]
MDYIDIFIKNDYIDLKQIAESGQCFRWKKMCPGRYFVISDGRAACFFQEKTGIRILCREKDEEYFRRYLDLDMDYGKVIEKIDEKDDFLTGAAQMGRGIRILRQNLWEMIISFIISQRNNIPRIMKSIDALCEKLGEQIVFDYEGEHLVGYTFPAPEVIVGADLSEFKFGYREKYIRQTAEDILEGKFDLEEVKDAVDEGKTPEQVKEMLKQLKGVGEKVASCIQLFGLHQLELFPIDTWIAKVEKMYYNGHFPVEKYKDTAGIMQQYLFFRVREDADKRVVLEMKREVNEKAASKTSFKEEMTEKIDKQTKRKNEISPENNSLEESRFKKDKLEKIELKESKLKKDRLKKGKSEEIRSEANRYNLSGKMLYVSDLDGTLLNSDALLNEDVPERLNHLIDKGLCFTVATARTYATVNSIVKNVHLTYPMILMNGVMLYDPISKSCINAEIIERDSVEYILKGRKKFGVTGFAYALSPEISKETLESEIASNFEKNLKSDVTSNLKKNSNTGEDKRIQKSGRKMATYYEKIATEHMEKFYVERRDVYHKPFSKVEKLEDILGEDIIYFSICYEEEVLRPFYEYLKKDEKLNLNFYKDVYGDGLWYLEISHKNASKYYGIQKLRKLLHPAAITGMGDNLNDIPLFEACDRSCAVGNAHKAVKERADYILDTNLNAGVVKFLEKEMK